MDNNVEHIAVAWADTKIIELKRIPLVVPPTPPHLSPGVEYLTDSPFGGVKSIEETDPNPMDATAPTAQVFKVPLRNVSASWPYPGGGSNFKVPSITESRYPTAPGESTWEVVTFDNSDVTSWPPNPYDEDAPTHKVTLDILDSEELSTDLWLLCTGNSDYPGTAQWYLNRVSSGINMTETDRQERFDPMGVPTFYGHTLVGTTEYYEAPLRKCYEVELYIDVADNYYVESDGHWVAWSIEPYDVRPLFASKVAQSEAPFFVKFRECLGSNPNLMTVYSKVMAQSSGYDGAGASLIFYIDDVIPVIPDGAAAVFFEEDIGDTPQPPINAIQHIKIKLKSKDSSGQVDYSCSDGIYRSWQGDEH